MPSLTLLFVTEMIIPVRYLRTEILATKLTFCQFAKKKVQFKVQVRLVALISQSSLEHA